MPTGTATFTAGWPKRAKRSEPIEHLVLHVDGGARGNPGPAAIGVVIATPEGDRVEEFGRAIGRATNNVAEYEALLAGIRRALELGARELEVHADSLLVVRQVEGAWKVKDSGLRPLRAEARKLLDGLDAWEVRHVRRERNADADRLVNEALDAASA